MNLRQKAKMYKAALDEIMSYVLKLDKWSKKFNELSTVIHSEVRFRSELDISRERVYEDLVHALINKEEFKQCLAFYEHEDPFTHEKVYRIELNAVKPEVEVEDEWKWKCVMYAIANLKLKNLYGEVVNGIL